jgi:hypothetical protein
MGLRTQAAEAWDRGIRYYQRTALMRECLWSAWICESSVPSLGPFAAMIAMGASFLARKAEFVLRHIDLNSTPN